jgi:Protein of Unknown function (DUF2784)
VGKSLRAKAGTVKRSPEIRTDCAFFFALPRSITLSLFFTPMNAAHVPYQLLADLIVLVHVVFVIFAVVGGLLAARWRCFVWIHPPAVIWAAIVEFFGWVCPLTPLENWLRRRGGQGGYPSDFIAHYILPVLYPEGLTREVQIALGMIVVLLNLAIYAWIFRNKMRIRDF